MVGCGPLNCIFRWEVCAWRCYLCEGFATGIYSAPKVMVFFFENSLLRSVFLIFCIILKAYLFLLILSELLHQDFTAGLQLPVGNRWVWEINDTLSIISTSCVITGMQSQLHIYRWLAFGVKLLWSRENPLHVDLFLFGESCDLCAWFKSAGSEVVCFTVWGEEGGEGILPVFADHKSCLGTHYKLLC